MVKAPAATENEIIERAEYIVVNNATVREVAEKFKVSKSTVHSNIQKYLKDIDFELFKEVRKVLDKNKKERHIRGGMATRAKFKNQK